MKFFHATFAIRGHPLGDLLLWTGTPNLVLDGELFQGAGELLSVGDISLERAGYSRVEAGLLAHDPDLRRALSRDYGPLPVELNMIMSTDGHNWIKVGAPFTGLLSEPTLQGDVFSITLETRRSGKADDGTLEVWSAEAQRERDPTDKGMEYMPQLDSSINIYFPT